jgi:hypothetical protein
MEIFNEKGKKKCRSAIKNTTGFIMPFNLEGEV